MALGVEGAAMKITIQITVESNDGQLNVAQEVAHLDRGTLRPETLGLTLAEARSILAGIEQTVVEQQAAEFMAQQRACSHCGHERPCKGRHHIVFRTPFGKLRLESPRLYHCQCESDDRTSFSPLAELLQERSSPELIYLETKFAALVSYGLTVELLKEVLPISQDLSTTTIRQRVRQTAQRLEDGLGEEQDIFIGGCQRDWDQLPDPAAPLIVGIDGGYVHAKDQRSRAAGWFEVIVGKSMSQDGESSKCFGFVNRYDSKPKRRLFEILKSQGMQMNQAVTFLSDGGDTVRDLQMYLNPQAEHLLHWFHISMRLTVMSQLVKSIDTDDQPNLSAEIEKELECLKWNLWHGNVHKALQIVEDLEVALDLEENSQEQRKLLKAVLEFGTYIISNRTFIANYGDRYRHGETISTGFVESAINQVVSKRMVKKQQMRWTDPGAHLLLQVRTRVLNEEWRSTLSRWYPGMQETCDAKAA
jgi:hypothetical protein